MIPITRPVLPPLAEFQKLLERIWETRMLSNFAEFSRRLESIAEEYLGVPARTVASGDIGLTCAISCLDVPIGAPCLVPSFTFNSTINAVLWNGLIPVFVDVDPETFDMDPEDARRTAARCGARLIVATHVFGNPCDASALRSVAAERGIPLVFDAAHGYGSWREGVAVGALGDVEVFSLSGTKPVTCAEGGLVTSRDPDFLVRFEHARAYGFQHDYETKVPGLNGKMSELHAALGTLTLPRIDELLGARDLQVARYRSALGALGGVTFQHVRACDRSTFKDFAVRFAGRRERDAVERALAEQGYQTKRYFRPCHRMRLFAPYADRPLPHTDALADELLCLPLFAELEDRQIDDICAVVARALAAARQRATPAVSGAAR
ncbi:MAG: DegT/DnrJ/EryC1/StrS aminotransferase family protein [Planctomycetes bacterium]|nr:DegT/DnrJ/EryC1/StrS aminotransferase family protein [Planctomycetota bacterium]